MLLTESYRELFTAVATCAAGLTGLLFVAISVGPRESVAVLPAVIQQIRAASALLAFINALAVSLFGLVSVNSAGYAAISVGVGGILFIAASIRSIVTSPDVSAEQAWRQAGLIVLLLAAFGSEVACGIGLTSKSTAVFGPAWLSYTLIVLLLVGIARAWELVGNRDTGIFASIVVLTGLDHRPAKPVGFGRHNADSADVAAPGTPGPRPRGPGGHEPDTAGDLAPSPGLAAGWTRARHCGRLSSRVTLPPRRTRERTRARGWRRPGGRRGPGSPAARSPRRRRCRRPPAGTRRSRAGA